MSLTANSKCLAYHGPLLYEAKILYVYDPKTKKISPRNSDLAPIPENLSSQQCFFIHYKGWKASWDEWVGAERICELTAENVQLQKSLKESVLSAARGASKPRSTGFKTGHADNGRRKRNYDESVHVDNYYKKPEIHLRMSSILKAILVNDWEYITKNHQLVPLPRVPNVSQIIDQFGAHVLSKKQKEMDLSEKDVFEEVLSGLKLYFDNALGHILLYRFERQQYKRIVHDKKYEKKHASEIYGAEHLLRLLSCMPGLVAQTSMDQQSITVLKNYLEQLLEYMEDHQELFDVKYENTSPAYDALSRG